MRERTVENYLKEEVKKAGGVSYKWSSPAHRGVPDQIVIFKPNRIFFVEVKKPTGVLSKLQKYVLNILHEFGCNTYVVYNKEDVNEFIRTNSKKK